MHSSTRAASAGIATALTLALTASGLTPAASDESRPTYPCADLTLAGGNPRDGVLADEFAWGAYSATKVGNGEGDIDWSADPYNRVSWRMWLNALRWLGSAVEAAGHGDTEARDHALAIVADWMRDHPGDWTENPIALEATMHRTNMILCLREATQNSCTGLLDDEFTWLDGALARHAEFLAEHYSGLNNHGVNESVGLVGAGVILERPDLVDIAVERLREALPVAIDDEGANNEQTTGYVLLNYDLWQRAARTLEAGHVAPDLQDDITARLRKLATFLAHATNSLGYHHQIGDSERRRLKPLTGTPHEYIATAGATGRPPEARVAVYKKGYVFGRSGWGQGARSLREESAYSLRFGPPRILHGHQDKQSITYLARGRDVLIDTGLGETTRDAWDAYFKGPEAHNALVTEGMTSMETRLDSIAVQPRGADVYRVSDRPAPGVHRTRDAVFLTDPDLLLVVDRATATTSRDFRQLWHLPAGGNVTLSQHAVARSADGSLETTIMPLRVDGHPLQGRLDTVTGATDPIQGWHWETLFKKQPAPVVRRVYTGPGTLMATAVIPSVRGETVKVETGKAPGGGTRWTFTVGEHTAIVERDASGTLTRTR